jgi:hypothetical protein
MTTGIRLTLAAMMVVFAIASGMAQGPAPQAPMPMQDMMKMHEQMMASMKAEDAKLDALLKDLTAAKNDDAKIAALTALVTELAQHHRTMRGQMHQMHMHMMGGPGRGPMAR